jgi:hypothetical protein
MAKKLPPDAIEPIATLFSEILFDLMIGMTKAKTVEAEFAKIQDAARKLTKDEMRRIADIAGMYCAKHSNPSPGKLSKERWATLKRKALEFALTTNGNDTETSQ